MATLTLTTSVPRIGASSRSIFRRVPLAVWNAALILVAIVLAGCYLVQVNSIMAHGYQIRDAERELGKLRTEVRSNQIKLSEIEAMGNLTAQAQSLGMVPVGQVDYITRPNAGVALR